MLGETDRYEELRDFLQNRMQMSHIYQPVMLMTLLGSGGRCHEKEIASALLSQDPTQVEYYTKVTNNSGVLHQSDQQYGWSRAASTRSRHPGSGNEGL